MPGTVAFAEVAAAVAGHLVASKEEVAAGVVELAAVVAAEASASKEVAPAVEAVAVAAEVLRGIPVEIDSVASKVGVPERRPAVAEFEQLVEQGLSLQPMVSLRKASLHQTPPMKALTWSVLLSFLSCHKIFIGQL